MDIHLDELKNQITQTTSAYFEPALDYVIVKIPRWNFDKFKGANDTLGFQMKTVGEVMAIGRSFAEAIQKACQSLENEAVGLGYYGKSLMHAEEVIEYIKIPKWDRIFRIKDALMAGVSCSHEFAKAQMELTAGSFTRFRRYVIAKKRLQNNDLKTFS